MTDEALVQKAVEASKNARASVSDFPVGAAVLSSGGRVYTGCNVESPSLLQVFCAERVALLAALAAGETDFVSVAVYAPKRPGITPCGLCRQMLAEFAPSIRILLVSSPGEFRVTSLTELLPEGFLFNQNI